MRTVLFGGTDLTQAVADRIADHLVGVVAIPQSFSISYAPGGLPNTRFADLVRWARGRGIPAVEWSGADDANAFVADLTPEWGLAAGWYYLLPPPLIEAFPRGIAGLHASLLPRLRGNAPLSWAIINGDDETGISLFELTAGMDEGRLYGQARIPIGGRSTIAELVTATEAAGIELVADALAAPDRPRREQRGDPTYCLARVPDDGRIDWRASATTVDRLVRASTRPYPGAFTYLEGRRVAVWAGTPVDVEVAGAPGQVWRMPSHEVAIVCGSGAFRIEECSLVGDAGEGDDDAIPILREASMRRLDDAAG
jgi:methionyl-tRNA formyltransferase